MSFFEQVIKRMRNYIIHRLTAGVATEEVNNGIRTCTELLWW